MGYASRNCSVALIMVRRSQLNFLLLQTGKLISGILNDKVDRCKIKQLSFLFTLFNFLFDSSSGQFKNVSSISSSLSR